MTTNPQTRPTLLGINHDGPVRVREVAGELDWIVQLENFGRVVEMINRYGGPDFWTVEPA